MCCARSITDIKDMFNLGLFINDLSMHDFTRDMVLAGSQQQAELKLALDQVRAAQCSSSSCRTRAEPGTSSALALVTRCAREQDKKKSKKLEDNTKRLEVRA